MCTESGEQERKGERNREGGWDVEQEVVCEKRETISTERRKAEDENKVEIIKKKKKERKRKTERELS